MFSERALKKRLVALEEIMDAVGNPADLALALARIAQDKGDAAKQAGDESRKVAWNWIALEFEDASLKIRMNRVNPYGESKGKAMSMNPNAPIVHLVADWSTADAPTLCGAPGEWSNRTVYRDSCTCPACLAIGKEAHREDPPAPGLGLNPQGLIGGRR